MEKCQPACKPGSVEPEKILERGDHSSGTTVAGRLKQPTRATDWKGPGALASAASPLFGFAPGGVCPAVRVTAAAVRSYRTLSPLPQVQAPGRSAFCGT